MFMMPTIDMVATGKNIERLRKIAGLSVRDLQDVFGFATPQAIYKWQHGTAMPTIDELPPHTRDFSRELGGFTCIIKVRMV